MFLNKKSTLTISVIALTCALSSISSNSYAAKAKKKSKSGSSSAACIACLNSFNIQTLSFENTDVEKCNKTLAKCVNSNNASRCESIIKDCLQQNCVSEGSCSDEMSNRALIAGCLQTADTSLPYLCANIISGYASNKASEVKAKLQALATQREQAIKAEETKQKQIAQEAELKKKQLELENQQKQKELEIQAELQKQQIAAKLEAQQKQEEYKLEQQAKSEERNSKPTVKYNKVLSGFKTGISNAKNYSTKVFNLLGIEETTENPTNGTATYFPKIIISKQPISEDDFDSDAINKIKSLTKSSRYNKQKNFQCTKDTKESFVKTELNNIKNILQELQTTFANDIETLEELNETSEDGNTVDEDKIENLYSLQNSLSSTRQMIDMEIGKLKTTCETRCAGMASVTYNMPTLTLTPLEFDEKGNIKENKATQGSKPDEYTCKDFSTTQNINAVPGLLAGSNSTMRETMVGGIGQQVSRLTQRVMHAVVDIDRELEKLRILAQLGKGGINGSSYSYNGSSSNSNELCGNKWQTDEYLECLRTTVTTQGNDDTKKRKALNKIISNLQGSSNNNPQVRCDNNGNLINLNNIKSNANIKDIQGCLLSLNSLINSAIESYEKNNNQYSSSDNTGKITDIDINNKTVYVNYNEEYLDSYMAKILGTNAKSCRINPVYYNNNTSALNLDSTRITCSCNGKSPSLTIGDINSGKTQEAKKICD